MSKPDMARALAFIHDSPMTGTTSHISYADLLDRVNWVAAMMQDRALEKATA